MTFHSAFGNQKMWKRSISQQGLVLVGRNFTENSLEIRGLPSVSEIMNKIVVLMRTCNTLSVRQVLSTTDQIDLARQCGRLLQIKNSSRLSFGLTTNNIPLKFFINLASCTINQFLLLQFSLLQSLKYASFNIFLGSETDLCYLSLFHPFSCVLNSN